MAANQRQAREHSHLPTARWSDWERAMVPRGPQTVGKNRERGGPNQVGFMCSSIRNAFPWVRPDTAEFMNGQLREHCPINPIMNYVVYFGNTCAVKPGASRGRILDYCTNGSHKPALINYALGRGYELWVRVKIVEGKNPTRELQLKTWKTHFLLGMTMLGT